MRLFLPYAHQNNPLFPVAMFFLKTGNLKDALCHVANWVLVIQDDTFQRVPYDLI